MTEPAATLPVPPSGSDAVPLTGPKVLLNGEAGTGKTYSLGTLADWCSRHEKEFFYLGVENSLETLLGYWRDAGKEIPECVHWHQAMAAPLSLTALIDGAQKVGAYTYEALTKMQDPNRAANNAFWKILSAMSDFPDDRTGKKFGPVDKWGIDRVLAIDSFTELSNAAFKMVVGNRPTAAPPDYGVAQNNLMNFLRLCTQGMACPLAITAHPARDKDEVTQTTKIQVATVGTAIQPQIPTLFSDVIWTVREGKEFFWDTAAYGVTTKTRSLGYRSKIPPDFAQIMDLWIKRGGK